MIIFSSVIGVILLILIWIITAPLTLCLNTDQPSRLLMVELKGIMKYGIFIKEGNMFFYSRIFFFTSEKELFKRKRDSVDRKKKRMLKRNEKKGQKSDQLD